MNIYIPPPKCSKCGSRSNESFQRGMFVSGIRCLNCKHEHVVDRTPSESSVVGYSYNPEDATF